MTGRRASLVLTAVSVLALGACGATEKQAPARVEGLSVALDFTPNAVHAPLFIAADRGADTRRGLRLRIRQPGEGPDALKLLAVKRVDVGIIDIHDLGLARERGIDVVGIGALVQKPLFWNAEGVALRERGRKTSEFRVERFGAPAYPEVVFMARRETVREQPERLRAFLAAVADGVRATRADPARATALIAAAAGAGEARLVRAQLDATLPLFLPSVRLDRGVLEEWAAFDARIGLLERRPDVGQAFAFDLAP